MDSLFARHLRHPRGWLAAVRRRLSGRGDTEHEQAIVRIAIIAFLFVYAAFVPLPQVDGPWWVPTVAQLGYIGGSLAILHFVLIVINPAVNYIRRSLWIAGDHIGLVLAMAVGGESMALFCPLLLWVTLGHGFRYGPTHLLASAAISVACFTPLVLVHPFWQAKGAFGIGFILALVLIPGYCYRLLHQLHDARRRAEESSEAKSRFLATMSHELRTPLHAILGMAELLRGTKLGTEQREMTRTIHTAGHSLLNMIQDILDIARIEAGAERLEIEDFDVHKLLHGIRDMLGYRAQTKALALRLRFDPDLPAALRGPRRSLEQILINLVTNAIKFTDHGEVRVEARLAGHDGSNAVLRVAVNDTGCGIPEAARARIFESFTQVDETTTRAHEGSGLGLAIVKRLIDSAGGTITLSSELGRGTHFEFDVPVTVVSREVQPATGLVVVHGVPSAHQLDVLRNSDLRWRRAEHVTSGFASPQTVDLWCASPGARPRLERHGRDLIVWGDGPPVDEALVVLPAQADANQLDRAVDAALVVADAADSDVRSDRVQSGPVSLDVLVADDNAVNQQVIERLLTSGGHRAVAVESGEAAIDAVDRSTFDVVVLDLNMPGMGGLAACRALHAREPRPRLVALTADASQSTRETCMAAGFDAFLTKPVDGTRLLGALQVETVEVDARHAAEPKAQEPLAGAVLDQRRLEMLRDLGGDDSFFDEIVDGFIEDGCGLIDEIKSAAAAGDMQRFRDATHALRSASTHLGAADLFDRCLAVKSLSSEVLSEQAATIGDDLDAAFSAVTHALRRAQGHPTAPPLRPLEQVSSPQA